MSSRTCVLCGAAALEEVLLPYEVEHHNQHRTFDDRCMRCAACGNLSYLGEQIADHQLSVANAIRDIDGLLSAEQLRVIRSKYKLRQTDMEQMLSIGPKTWTRWERGKIPQSKSTDKLIRAISEDPIFAYKLMLQSGVNNPEAIAVFEAVAKTAMTIAEASLKSALTTDKTIEDLVEEAFSTVDRARRQAAEEIEAVAA